MSLPLSTGPDVQADPLPLDILREIFLTFKDTFHIMDEHHARRAPPRTVISVSHVSRQWRNAAISCQHLWSTALPCGSLEWTRLCLLRCFSAPFDLAISGLDICEHDEYRNAFELVLPHLVRARKINFEFDARHHLEGVIQASDAARDLLYRLSTTSVPNVKELGIYYSIQDQPLDAITKLDFSESMPALDEIFLRGIVFPPSGQHIFPANLRILDLTDSNFWWTVDEMIEILRTMPMLEELEHEIDPVTFTHGLSPEPSRVYPLRCLELKKLRRLVCSCGSFARNMLLFSYISFPPNAMLQLIYPHSRPRWILEAHSSSPTEVTDIIPLGEAAIRDHFAAAIGEGAFYPDVVLNAASISVEGEFYIGASRAPVLPFGISAHQLLPSSIRMDIPQVGDEYRMHQDNPHEPRPFHDRLFDIWLNLPFFARASVLHLNPRFDNFFLRFLEHFSFVREIHFPSLYMLGGPFREMLLNDHPNHGRRLFPMLTAIHVACTGDKAQETESSKDDLTRFEKLADTILATWGASLKRIVLHKTEALVSRADTLALLKRRFGADRVVVSTDCTDWTPHCTCYVYRCPVCSSAAEHDCGEESDEESGSDGDE